MKAFVTGSTGLIGTNLVRLLVEKGYAVRALARDRRKAARALAGLDVEVVEGDVRHVAGFVDRLAGCDVLFHLAAYFREYYRPGDHREALRAVNVDATRALLEQGDRMGVGRAVFVGSAGVVGEPADGSPADERAPVSPGTRRNRYFRSKLEAEHEVVRFGQTHRLPVVRVLPALTFGPEDRGPTSAGELVLAFLREELPVIVPGGVTIVDARDVAATLEAAARRGEPGARYLAAASFVEYAELLRLLERVSGVPAPTRRIPKALALLVATLEELRARVAGRAPTVTRERLHAVFRALRWDGSKARRDLGVTFRPIEETLRDTVRWFQERRGEREAA